MATWRDALLTTSDKFEHDQDIFNKLLRVEDDGSPASFAAVDPPLGVRSTRSSFAEADGEWVATLSHQDPHISMGIRRSTESEPGSWELYTEPIAVEAGETITAFAVRYGWLESPQVERVAGTSTP